MNKHGGYQGKNNEMLDFSVNINPLGIPWGIREKLIAGIDELVKYPEITGVSAIEKIANDLAVRPENIILGNGAIELIYLFARSMGPGKALIVQPTFNEYERALKLYGWEVVHHVLTAEDNFTINPEALAAVINNEKPQAVFLCNPNNPTGQVYSNDFIREMLEHSAPEISWFLDESFMDFSEETGSLSLVKEARQSVFILKSLTKFYALPGLRIGYGVGVTPIIKKMEGFKEPWTINALGLIAATGVYDEKDYANRTKTYIKAERQRVFEALSQINTIKVFPSGTDFHLCQLLKGTVAELQIDLEKEGMSLRTCEDFIGLDHSYFRIAIKKEADNTKLLTFLKELEELKMGRLIFVTGGARSGKSTYAENLARESGKPVAYIATAIAFDDGMKDRIAKHQAQRPDHWGTIEKYKDFQTITENPIFQQAETVLFDCLTVMTTNNMLDFPVDYDTCSMEKVGEIEAAIKLEVEKLLDVCQDKTLIVVSNEVGLGLVPAYKLGSYFRDIAGRMNQLVAGRADEAYLLVAGLPMKLK